MYHIEVNGLRVLFIETALVSTMEAPVVEFTRLKQRIWKMALKIKVENWGNLRSCRVNMKKVIKYLSTAAICVMSVAFGRLSDRDAHLKQYYIAKVTNILV